MEFVNIVEERLWAVKYDGDDENCFDAIFDSWYDVNILRAFFKENLTDLIAYFHITEVDRAVLDTIDDASSLEALMLDCPDFDKRFRHLENSRYSEMFLGKEKTKGAGAGHHPSWLRLYAIKVDAGIYLVTGGAIKLTATMGERSHTRKELERLEMVRNHLISIGVFDYEGLNDIISDEQSS